MFSFFPLKREFVEFSVFGFVPFERLLGGFLGTGKSRSEKVTRSIGEDIVGSLLSFRDFSPFLIRCSSLCFVPLFRKLCDISAISPQNNIRL